MEREELDRRMCCVVFLGCGNHSCLKVDIEPKLYTGSIVKPRVLQNGFGSLRIANRFELPAGRRGRRRGIDFAVAQVVLTEA